MPKMRKGGENITVIPITLKQANEFVIEHHRHHKAVQGCKFCVGAVDNSGDLRGVAIVGRPVSRYLDNGLTAEVTRLCTDGYRNCCSFLYAVCERTARCMGFKRIQTYILITESGTSLKAANWLCGGECGGGNWNTSARPRKDSLNAVKKIIYFKNL